LPTLSTIATAYNQDGCKVWCFSILAGLSESWSDLTVYSKQVLKAALAVNLLLPSYYRIEDNTEHKLNLTGNMRFAHTNPNWYTRFIWK